MEGSIHGLISMYVRGICLRRTAEGHEVLHISQVFQPRFKLGTSQTQFQIITTLVVEQDE